MHIATAADLRAVRPNAVGESRTRTGMPLPILGKADYRFTLNIRKTGIISWN
jgi:hypothetical protein